MQSTFKSVKAWIQELRSFGPPNIVIAIAGNKCDLEDLREVAEKGQLIDSLCESVVQCGHDNNDGYGDDDDDDYSDKV